MMLLRARPIVSLCVVSMLSGVFVAGGDGWAEAGGAGSAPGDCGTLNGQGCAPESERVDLATPAFSNPTQITNPLFPISELRSVVLLGHVGGQPFRTETTLLPRTETIAWRGQNVEVLVSQYTAYLDGRLEEIAIDHYAQADDGSVWYFGEDVFEYRDGAVAATDTWLAGREAPAAMIMPGAPKVGDTYRPENVPGVVFEEVTVESVDKRVDGPRGKVAGAMVANELHVDGTHELKVFAPGYGEFRTGKSSGDLEALALAVPKDALAGPPSAELRSLSTGAMAIVESARLRDWDGAAATVERMDAARKALPGDAPPRPIAARLAASLREVRAQVNAHKPERVSRAAIETAQSALDLELRHRRPVEIDAARFELWTQQLRVDAAAKSLAGVTGDVAVLEWIRDRFASTLDPAGRAEVDSRLRDLRAAADAENLPAAADHAARLGARVRHLVTRQPLG
jgi:hypothetical protein